MGRKTFHELQAIIPPECFNSIVYAFASIMQYLLLITHIIEELQFLYVLTS